MAKRPEDPKTYARAIAFRQSPPEARRVVRRNLRCELLAVARRISRLDGERLDALRVSWRWIRWIGHGPSAIIRAERLQTVLAKYAKGP